MHLSLNCIYIQNICIAITSGLTSLFDMHVVPFQYKLTSARVSYVDLEI